MKSKMMAMVTLVAVMFIAGMARSDQFWGAASVPQSTTLTGSVLFKLDTATGTVGTTYTYSDWNIIMDVTYAPGNILYAVHNTTGSLDNFYNFKLAKVDAATGTVLSDTLVKNLTGTDEPQWNALEYHDGKLYAVENCWTNTRPGDTGSAYAKRGYIYEVGLDGSGDPISATLGAYIGGYPAPDGALAYRDGTWYASDWRDDAPHASSWIKTTTDIMNTNFTATLHTEPIGYFDGWDFEADGDLLGVSWYSDFNVYKINLSTGNPTALFNIQSQLPSNIESLSGLTAVPIPAATVALVPNALHVAPGSTVTVSVNMTVNDPCITMVAISAIILYDPNVFTYDANSGVVKGGLLTHFWDLSAGSPAEGELRVGGIDLGIYPEYFETLAAGSGKLFTFSLKAKEDAPTGPSALTFDPYVGGDNAKAGFDYGDKDFLDVILPLEAMSGASINVCPAGDLDGDCDVDFNDLAILANNWLVGT